MKVPAVALRKLDRGVHTRAALVLFTFSGELGKNSKLTPAVRAALGPEIVARAGALATRRAFKGTLGEALHLPTHDEQLVLAVGLGDRSKFTLDTLRQASAMALRTLEKLRVKDAVLVWPTNLRSRGGLHGAGTGAVRDAEAVTAATEGLVLGAYEFDKYKTAAKSKFSCSLVELAVQRPDAAAKRALSEALTVADAVNWARDLENDNSDDVNPQHFEALTREVAKQHKLRVTAITGDDLKKRGLNLIHAVGRASQWAPRLLLLEYRGAGKKAPVRAIVGKGVTFDTGGVNLKPARGGSIESMHLDMSGAATALTTIRLAAQLKLKVNLVAVLPIAENVIDSHSVKPGAVVTAYGGTTVEIANTDAEGRLILADAIAYVRDKYTPANIVSIATLTGAVIVAIGDSLAGLIGNDEPTLKQLERAGDRVGEHVWRFPLTDHFREQTAGTRADLSNLGKKPKEADHIVATAFLEKFAKDVPYVHIDIAGASMLSAQRGYMPEDGTGFGVRLLVEYLRSVKR